MRTPGRKAVTGLGRALDLGSEEEGVPGTTPTFCSAQLDGSLLFTEAGTLEGH